MLWYQNVFFIIITLILSGVLKKFQYTIFYTAQVCDFGISKLKTTTMTQPVEPTPEQARGTHTHIPPEVFEDINVKPDYPRDVYAFAVTVWEIFTGKKPYGSYKKVCLHSIFFIELSYFFVE